MSICSCFRLYSEAEREATIARNRALLAQLDVSLDIPKAPSKAKPPAKAKTASTRTSGKRKRSLSPAPAVPSRQSTRLRRSAPVPNETPEQKRVREVCRKTLRKLHSYQIIIARRGGITEESRGRASCSGRASQRGLEAAT
jgi:hypothetical protein